MFVQSLKQVVLDCDMRHRGINLARAHRVGLAQGDCALFVNVRRTIVEAVVGGKDAEIIGARRWRRSHIPFDLGAMATVLAELGVRLEVTGKLARTLEEKLTAETNRIREAA